MLDLIMGVSFMINMIKVVSITVFSQLPSRIEIIAQYTVLGIPKQNGVAEKKKKRYRYGYGQ